MKSLNPQIKKYSYQNGEDYWLVSCTLPNGDRYRKKHSTLQKAYEDKGILLSSHNTSVTLAEIELAKAAIAALRCSKNPDTKGKTLLDAVNFFCAKFVDTEKVPPLADLIDEFKARKRQEGLRDDTISEIVRMLDTLKEDFKGQTLHDIATKEMMEIYLTRTHKPNRNRKAAISQFFNYLSGHAQRTNRDPQLLRANPIRLLARKIKQESDLSEVKICDTQEVKALLREASKYNAQRMFVWLFFTGMRPFESVRFWKERGWKSINLQTKLIQVDASIAKTRRNRTIKIQPNLLAWLERYKDVNFLTKNWRDKFCETKKILTESKREINDIARHTWISYLLKICQNDWGDVELQAGNTKQIQLTHYLSLLKDNPNDFWSITPDSIGVFDVSEDEYATRGTANRRRAILENKKKVKHKNNGQPL